MSKIESAHLTGVSAATIDRIERGETCRKETMRKNLLALHPGGQGEGFPD